ncbi:MULTISPECIES: metal-dependent hydrolase [unclassified Tenacibaculum]|uniref:metal-dependent hydrolase n=1 Tax=unclassified Tenacibaculum TaxID=2635139 RepID=UPI001F489AAE|nr:MULTISPECIES: metal-dependent hydrolase [unclassified Tenacibaculum]MCF2874090.1 metal-dependent hydrolase [Tenacibaculum sp. Cn5-1]MCF2934671.1 metal-dependent hydrolase [Tenacibaculum sp. Cn5-34]MCG7510881.1 metal-dependent hydrolase [Tenacibaculum sp. Cn5-46]
MNITFYGHACFGIEINGTHVLVDPFITGNPLASEIKVEDIKADYILLTHAHQDHILDVELIAERTGATIVSNYEIVMHYGAKNLKGHPVNHGGTFKTEAFSAKYVNAVHTSSFPDGTYGGQPGGFVISAGDKSLYIAGDTAVTMDMKLIPMTTKLSASILPIGDNFTMGVDDAIIASNFVECDKVIGCHFNTFPPIEINVEEAKEAFAKANKELTIIEIGKTISI